MRNTLVHNLEEIPGWDGLETEEGQQAALRFLVELAFASMSVTALFGMLMHVSAKEDYGVVLFKTEEEKDQQIFAIIESQFGPIARDLLKQRYRKPSVVPRKS